MKKFFAIIFAIALLCGVACAEGIDWASMTDNEINAVIEAAKAELDSRNTPEDSDDILMLVDIDDIKVYLTRTYSTLGSKEDEFFSIQLDGVVENDSEKEITVDIASCSINGWEASGSGIFSTRPGKKQKGSFDIYAYLADVYSIEEIEELEITLSIWDNESYSTFFTSEPIIIPINKKE